ncbi:MAG: hypothetical protein EXS22_10315 [Pedosphaera sp.]|nr:hypothetical protein [Pedosphaera sp.]MSU44407.1 hypothetical protein [Pedosphaera sp.]
MRWIAVLVSLSLWLHAAAAEPPAPSAPGLPDGTGGLAAMLKLLEGQKPFTAKMDLRLLGVGDQEVMVSQMAFAYRDGMARLDVDVAKMQSEKLTPQVIAAMRTLKLDQSIACLLPKQNTLRTIYPGLRAYCDMPMPPRDAAVFNAKLKIAITPDGTEKILGLACQRQRVTLTPEKGEPIKLRVWRAEALDALPVQYEMPEGRFKARLLLSNLQWTPPELSDFAPPNGHRKFPSLQALLKEAKSQVPAPKK